MVDIDIFDAYINKRFKNGQEVVVHNLGSNMEGVFRAKVKGIYSFRPHECYIIEWHDKEQMKKYNKDEEWDCCVMSKACMTDLREYQLKHGVKL